MGEKEDGVIEGDRMRDKSGSMEISSGWRFSAADKRLEKWPQKSQKKYFYERTESGTIYHSVHARANAS